MSRPPAGVALCYLQQNQVSELSHLRTLTSYDLAHYVALDATTRRNLELTATLRDGRTEVTMPGEGARSPGPVAAPTGSTSPVRGVTGR